MPKRVSPLTAAAVAHAKPGSELIDGAVAGLRLRVGPGGARTWSLNIRDASGVRRRFDVGIGLSLAEAREKAQDLKRQVRSGANPTLERRQRRERSAAAQVGIGTFESVVELYFGSGPGKGLRSRDEQVRRIRSVFAKALKRPAVEVTAIELQRLADRHEAKTSARAAVAYLNPIVAKWAPKRGYLAGKIELEKPELDDEDMEEGTGQRVLSVDELQKVLPHLGSDEHGRAARFVLLTGVRRGEVTAATWGEFDLDAATWTITAGRRKDTRSRVRRKQVPMPPQIVPLSRQAVALLREVRAIEESRRAKAAAGVKSEPEPIGSADLVFVGKRGAALDNWDRWLKALAKVTGVAGWSLHPLRRTASTEAAEVGAEPHVVSTILGHRNVSGQLHGIYNKSRYLRQHAEALQRLADHLDAIEAGQSNVVPLHRVAAE